MALTPEDVVNKRFQPTKFREGYDQDEVDDFLDDVVNELRRLTAENEDLREKLGACERRVGELSRGGAPAEPEAEPASSDDETAAGARVPVPAGNADDQPADEDRSPVAAAAGAPAAAVAGPEAAAGMLQLAQRLHDDYVRSGEEQRDKILGDAKEHADRLVREAEEQQRETLGSLEREKTLLERKIDELRSFERDYRARLKSYLEGQLRELEARGVGTPSGNAETT
jgi:DivIVA domain-containing protein